MEHEIGFSIDTAFELNDANQGRSAGKKAFEKKYNLKSRRSKYSELKSQLESKFNAIHRKTHSDLMERLVQFVRDYRSNLNHGDQFKLSFVRTGIISISCSTTEHEFIFKQLVEALQEEPLDNVSTNVISVSASEKVTVERIIEMIYDRVLTDRLLACLGIEDERSAKKFRQSLRFEQFAKIYQEQVGNEPIILIIDDLIFMNYETMNHLFRFLHGNLSRVPVLVFCGLSQASVSLQSVIRPETLSTLLIHSFASRKINEIRDEVFASILIQPDLKLKFGARCLDYFGDAFCNYDFSIKNIERLAKLAIWNFCYSNEYAFLNGTAEEFERKLNGLGEDDLLKSWRSLKSLEVIKAETDVTKQLVELFKKVQVIESDFMSELKALHELIGGQTKAFYQLYVGYLLRSGEELEEAAKGLRLISKDEWKTRLQNVIEKDSSGQTRLVQEILRPQFEKLDEASEQNVPVAEQKSIKTEFTHRFYFSKTNEQKAKNSALNSPFNRWKHETVSLIKKHFSNLSNPFRAPLNELFYYNDVEQLKQLDLVPLREQVRKRLVSAEDFARSMRTTGEKENNKLSNFRPDICVAFQLYRESQVKINLADWLESYKAQLEQTENDKSTATRGSKKIKVQTSQTDLIKRFFSNVNDLNYLGILEMTSRSTDYATKLIL